MLVDAAGVAASLVVPTESTAAPSGRASGSGCCTGFAGAGLAASDCFDAAASTGCTLGAALGGAAGVDLAAAFDAGAASAALFTFLAAGVFLGATGASCRSLTSWPP